MDQTRRLLVAAATRLFHEQGYSATSVGAIVAEAGVTKGALYHHFGGKQDLLHEIQHNYMDERLRNCQEIAESSDPPIAQLRQLVRESLLGVDRHRAEVALFMQERRFLSDQEFAAIKQKRDQVEEAYLSVLRRGIEDGTFRRDIEPRIVTFSIIGIGAWASTWYSAEGRMSVDEVGDQMARQIVSGLVEWTV